jgi:hypothetical protein
MPTEYCICISVVAAPDGPRRVQFRWDGRPDNNVRIEAIYIYPLFCHLLSLFKHHSEFIFRVQAARGCPSKIFYADTCGGLEFFVGLSK